VLPMAAPPMALPLLAVPHPQPSCLHR